MASLLINIPIRTESEMNRRDHWAKVYRRKKEQQRTVYLTWRQAMFGRRSVRLPCVVRLTRIAPQRLDDDNLQSACKFVRDEVAKLLGVDDGDERISFEYDQRVDSEYAVMIQVEGAK